MNKALLISVLFLIISCGKPKNYGSVFYFEQKDLLSIVPISCADMENYRGLRKLNLTNKELFDSLYYYAKKINIDTQYDPDVRYKIIISNDTLCIDYDGYFIMNSENRGRIYFIEELEKFIQNNKKLSKPITEETPKPWK